MKSLNISEEEIDNFLIEKLKEKLGYVPDNIYTYIYHINGTIDIIYE